MKNINLVLKKRSQSQGIQRIGKIASYISVAVIIIFIIAYIASFSILTYLTAKFKYAQSQISDYTAKINQKRDIEGITLASILKLYSIEEILGSQIHYPSVFKEIYSLPSDGIIFKSISIIPSGLVNIEMTASSSAILNNFVNLITEKDEVENKFKGIIASGIKRDTGGSFSLNLSFNIAKSKFNE